MGRAKGKLITHVEPGTVFNRVPEHKRFWTNRFVLSDLTMLSCIVLFILYMIYGIYFS